MKIPLSVFGVARNSNFRIKSLENSRVVEIC